MFCKTMLLRIYQTELGANNPGLHYVIPTLRSKAADRPKDLSKALTFWNGLLTG